MSPLRGLAAELRTAAGVLRHELRESGARFVEVSGVLAEQLARELGAGARPAAVRVGGSSPSLSAEVLVRVIAGDPTEDDETLVRTADGHGIPVVLVQLWPQAEWTRPFVLSPFVVECRAGEGFPVRRIADAVVDAVDPSSDLASSVPSIRPSLERKVVVRSVLRAAALGALKGGAPTRPLITLEQVRMVARLSGGHGGPISAEPASLGAVTAAVLASGYAFRGVARSARFVLPPALANAAVAAAGTWALATAARAYGSRRPS